MCRTQDQQAIAAAAETKTASLEKSRCPHERFRGAPGGPADLSQIDRTLAVPEQSILWRVMVRSLVLVLVQMPDTRPFLQPQRRPRPDGRLPDSSQQDVRQDRREKPEGRSVPLRVGDLGKRETTKHRGQRCFLVIASLMKHLAGVR